ncbi:MAG: tryptophan--tRNA ligase [Patescibacteria group bacterium]
MTNKNTKHRVLAGIRATGRLHLGNYLGAVKGMLELQDDPNYETYYMVADVHTITTPYNVEELRKNRREVIIDYLAAGLDPEKSVIFQQSEVKEHLELAFYFSSVNTIARMQHLPTFKEKVKQYPENTTMALLNYPVLMAADIMAYKADSVPVGRDQEPHLEITREVAKKMNARYGTGFPEAHSFKTTGEYVPSLTGVGKMSKSVEGSFINLVDGLNTIQQKIAKIPTDAGQGDCIPSSGGVANLLQFVELFQGTKRRREYEEQYTSSGLRYGDIKKELSQAVYEELKPIQARRKELEADTAYVDKVIREGAEKARKIASVTVEEVREKMGLS